MEYFLEACVIVFNKLLAFLHDTLFSLNIRKEERDTLFTAENIYTFQVMCGLHHNLKFSMERKLTFTLGLG